MSVKDIIKNSILEEFNRAELSSGSMLVCLEEIFPGEESCRNICIY